MQRLMTVLQLVQMKIGWILINLEFNYYSVGYVCKGRWFASTWKMWETPRHHTICLAHTHLSSSVWNGMFYFLYFKYDKVLITKNCIALLLFQLLFWWTFSRVDLFSNFNNISPFAQSYSAKSQTRSYSTKHISQNLLFYLITWDFRWIVYNGHDFNKGFQ